MEINKDNFYVSSYAYFTEVERTPFREPDFISYKKEWIKSRELGSLYKREGDFLISIENGEKHKIAEEYRDLIRIETNKVSSQYWYSSFGVYRKSNHWGEVTQCEWNLRRFEGEDEDSHGNKEAIGYCKWIDFIENTEDEPLEYIDGDDDWNEYVRNYRNIDKERRE